MGNQRSQKKVSRLLLWHLFIQLSRQNGTRSCLAARKINVDCAILFLQTDPQVIQIFRVIFFFFSSLCAYIIRNYANFRWLVLFKWFFNKSLKQRQDSPRINLIYCCVWKPPLDRHEKRWDLSSIVNNIKVSDLITKWTILILCPKKSTRSNKHRL